MAKGSFACVVNCMDGRVQEPMNGWMKKRFGVDYVDVVSEPGPDGILAKGKKDLTSSIKARVEISVYAHGAKVVAVTSHHDCAGNPVTKEKHLEHLAKSVEVIRSWGLPVRVLGLWINESWEPELIHDLE